LVHLHFYRCFETLASRFIEHLITIYSVPRRLIHRLIVILHFFWDFSILLIQVIIKVLNNLLFIHFLGNTVILQSRVEGACFVFDVKLNFPSAPIPRGGCYNWSQVHLLVVIVFSSISQEPVFISVLDHFLNWL
jgi:hypothetical protein